MKGLIFNIQRFSIHDGPGIRTVVFFKGCPLRCVWCHNPEGQSFSKEMIFWEDRCINCRTCESVCESKAVNEPSNCILCGKCVEVCPASAREIAGKEVCIDEVMNEIKKDSVFYDQSGGGVTFSGGEPFYQYDFLISILKECKKEGIHTAIETCGFSKWEFFYTATKYTDLFLYDIKIADEEAHKKFTGVSNKIILENLKMLSSINERIIIRIPVIPGVNDNFENFFLTSDFISSLSLKEVHLLPYHKGGIEKYRRLRKEFRFSETREIGKESLLEFSKIFEEKGIKVKIGG
ncbi:MAG: glycyl-radical enzyme activating protein [Candidatus Aminicenantia bacterium]